MAFYENAEVGGRGSDSLVICAYLERFIVSDAFLALSLENKISNCPKNDFMHKIVYIKYI